MMNTGPKQTHYKILGIPAGASPSEIIQAYREMVALYRDDNMAASAFFGDAERKEILGRLEKAYLTLIHPESRLIYDRSLIEAGMLEEADRYHQHLQKVMPIYDLRHKKTLYPWLSKAPVEEKVRLAEDPSIRDILNQEHLTGQDLKRIRTQQGVTLTQIFQQTRVRIGLLEAIEEGRFDQLPPAIYLKNFLKLYAQSLGIDADAVVSAYMKHTKGES